MGRARRKEAVPDDTKRKQKGGVDEIKSKDGGEEGIVQEQRKVIESRKGHNREDIALQERETGSVDWEETVTDPQEKQRRASQVRPGSEHSSLKEDDYKIRLKILERPKRLSEGNDFTTSNFRDETRPESQSRDTYVKLWTHKESPRNDQSPRRMKVHIGSLSCGDTLRFLEAEKARMIGEIRAEHEKKLGSARDTKVLMEKTDKTSREVEDIEEMAWYVVHDGKEVNEEKSGKPMEPKERGGGSMEEECERAVDRTAEIKARQWTERDETCSQELRSRPLSRRTTKQKAGKELSIADENTVQPEAKAKSRSGQEDKPAGVLRGQVPAPKGQTDAKGPIRPSPCPIFDIVKIDERTTENSTENKGGTATLLFHPPGCAGSKSYKSCQGHKWRGRFEKYPVGSVDCDKGRAAKQGAGEEEEKELQNRALFHLEALRRIEERYNKRRTRAKSDYFGPKRPNEVQLQHPGCWDYNCYSEVQETKKHQVEKLQKKGKGGLNALLAPVFEEEVQRRFQDLDQHSPTNSEGDKQVLIFQRMKRALLRAAEEQVAAAKARANKKRAQLKATPEKVEKVRGLERAADRQEKTIRREWFKTKRNSFPTKQVRAKFFTYAPSSNFKAPEQPVKRIKELNEKARVEEELEGERRQRAKIKQEERRVRLRKGAQECVSLEIYRKLSKDDRRERLGLPSGFSSRFKSPIARSQKLNSSTRMEHPRFSPQEMNSRFKSALASPRKDIRTNALEHFANWEKELRISQRSKSRSMERSKERRVTIHEDPMQSIGKRENLELTSGSGGKALLTTNRLFNGEQEKKSPPRNQSPVSILSNEAVPDHYNSVEEGCICDVKYKKETKKRTRGNVLDEKTAEKAKGARRRDNCQSLNWLGKLYNSISSFS